MKEKPDRKYAKPMQRVFWERFAGAAERELDMSRDNEHVRR